MVNRSVWPVATLAKVRLHEKVHDDLEIAICSVKRRSAWRLARSSGMTLECRAGGRGFKLNVSS